MSRVRCPRTLWVCRVGALIGCLTNGNVWSGPPNDTCDTAEDLGLCPDTVFLVDTKGAGPGVFGVDPDLPPGSPSCQWNGNPTATHNTIWYRFTADATGQAFVSTCATEGLGLGFLDSIVAVYEGTCGSLTEVACAENECSLGDLWLSRECFPVVAGTEYYVMVGNPGDWVGSIPGTVRIEVSCACPGSPSNDDCANPLPVATGVNTISNQGAGNSGPDHGAGSPCDLADESDIPADVWFIWTAENTDSATISLCGGTFFDTKLAVYRDGPCPPPTNGVTLLGCDDDGCGIVVGPSRIELPVEAGEDYLIRIGGVGRATGELTLTILNPAVCGDGFVTSPEECDPPGPDCGDDCLLGAVCPLSATGHPPAQSGQGIGAVIGATSDLNPGAHAAIADNFQPIVSGPITEVCWWGLYISFNPASDCGPGTGDDFTVTYYDTNPANGLPGNVLDSFDVKPAKVLSGFIATGIGNVREYEYHATHPPVSFAGGGCYWLEITNHTLSSCLWLWETALPGSRSSAQDEGLNGYSLSEVNDFDLAWNIDLPVTFFDCSGACCNESSGNCVNDSPESPCVLFGGRFERAKSCADLDPACGEISLPYVRGDGDGNGQVNFLVDALFLLSFGFVPGSPVPPCSASADVDGNRELNALIDGLYALNAGFVPGNPLPPAPYPSCGEDAVGIRVFGCETPPPCP